jgi:hypothetical protein
MARLNVSVAAVYMYMSIYTYVIGLTGKQYRTTTFAIDLQVQSKWACIRLKIR